jgi:hypothetical protein
VIVGSSNTISATTPQTLNGTTYAFDSWSDGGAQTHTVVAPASAATYTATYHIVSGLVAAYGFNEGSGTTTADASGNANTGTTSNTTWTSSGKYGSALSFNGTNSWVTVADANSLDLTSALTLEAWGRPSSLSGWRAVLVKEQPSELCYSLYANSDTAAPVGDLYIGGAEQILHGTSAVPLNTWTHLALTYDGATMRLYVNGTQVSSQARTGNVATSANALRIGGDSVWGEYFNGLIDEVRVYNRALSASEIQTDMNTPL